MFLKSLASLTYEQLELLLCDAFYSNTATPCFFTEIVGNIILWNNELLWIFIFMAMSIFQHVLRFA